MALQGLVLSLFSAILFAVNFLGFGVLWFSARQKSFLYLGKIFECGNDRRNCSPKNTKAKKIDSEEDSRKE